LQGGGDKGEKRNPTSGERDQGSSPLRRLKEEESTGGRKGVNQMEIFPLEKTGKIKELGRVRIKRKGWGGNRVCGVSKEKKCRVSIISFRAGGFRRRRG